MIQDEFVDSRCIVLSEVQFCFLCFNLVLCIPFYTVMSHGDIQTSRFHLLQSLYYLYQLITCCRFILVLRAGHITFSMNLATVKNFTLLQFSSPSHETSVTHNSQCCARFVGMVGHYQCQHDQFLSCSASHVNWVCCICSKSACVSCLCGLTVLLFYIHTCAFIHHVLWSGR